MKKWRFSLRVWLVERSAYLAFFYRWCLLRRLSKKADWTRLRHWEQQIKLDRLIDRKFAGRYDITAKVQRDCLLIDIFAPRFLWNRKGEKNIANKAIFPWFISIAKVCGRPWWHQATLALGRLCTISTSWDNGDRCLVNVRLWLWKSVPALSLLGNTAGWFEFSHQLYLIDNKREQAISMWWWGPGSFRMHAPLMHMYPLYRRFGKLFYRHTKHGIRGYLGVDLSPEIKEKIYYQYCGHFARPDCMGWYAQVKLDAAMGRSRNQFLEVYSARCIDCGCRHNPNYYEWLTLRCDPCGVKASEAEAAA